MVALAFPASLRALWCLSHCGAFSLVEAQLCCIVSTRGSACTHLWEAQGDGNLRIKHTAAYYKNECKVFADKKYRCDVLPHMESNISVMFELKNATVFMLTSICIDSFTPAQKILETQHYRSNRNLADTAAACFSSQPWNPLIHACTSRLHISAVYKWSSFLFIIDYCENNNCTCQGCYTVFPVLAFSVIQSIWSMARINFFFTFE